MAEQKYALLVDYTYFSGNHAAEIACKEELGLSLDQFGIKEVEVGPFREERRQRWRRMGMVLPSVPHVHLLRALGNGR